MGSGAAFTKRKVVMTHNYITEAIFTTNSVDIGFLIFTNNIFGSFSFSGGSFSSDLNFDETNIELSDNIFVSNISRSAIILTDVNEGTINCARNVIKGYKNSEGAGVYVANVANVILTFHDMMWVFMMSIFAKFIFLHSICRKF